MGNNITYYDNYLDPRDHEKIKKVFFSDKIPWEYCPTVVKSNNTGDHFQFVHRSYYYTRGIMSESFEILKPLVSQLKMIAIHRIKTNMIHRTNENIVTGFHTDISEKRFIQSEATTAIYYVNSNNGGTRFENGTHIDSVENRICIFPYDMKHSSVTCTDEKVRVTININFFR